ncbi:FCS-Like Zinc finger 6 [Diospyros lotus]|uniref:FCS-Like Zinc finger 6 n=1 Tax=Diospyros lotus TaxID=55363 RepID=UPI00225AF27E|nr:FCS-Like Zinc finger 6 [Diospyros lotus]
MLLGKRPRPPMKRTTSMTEFTLDLSIGEPSDPLKGLAGAGGSSGARSDHSFLATSTASQNHRRNSTDFIDTAHFLRACSLCKRRLISGRDIYMYRGDSAFCSLECRQQQMAQDERKERSFLASKMKEALPAGAAARSDVVSAKGGAAAAV